MTTSTTNTAAREFTEFTYAEAVAIAQRNMQENCPSVSRVFLARIAELEATLTQQQGGEQEAGDDREYDGAVRGLLHAAKQVDREAWGKGAANISLEAIKALTSAHDYLAALRTKQPAASEGEAVDSTFAEWLASEMPAGTVIGDPMWWANRIARQYQVRCTPRHPADEKVQIKSSTIELALFEEENETAYPGYARLHIPYDAWNWDMNVENLLVNRKNIDFAQTTEDYYNKTPITHIRAAVDGKAQRIRLSGFLSLGPAGITPSFSAGQLCIAVL